MTPDADPRYARAPGVTGYTNRFGAVYEASEEDANLFAFLVEDHHLNLNGVCHGGAMMTFADIALGRSARKALADQAKFAVTANLMLDFVAAARPGEWVISRASVLHRGRNLFFTEARMRCGERLVARANATFAILDR